MQIVIDIDEETYRYMQSRCKYQNKGDKGLSKFEEVGVAIKNGTLLPEEHGRLIDADALYYQQTHKCGYYTPFELIDKYTLNNASTILIAQHYNN